MPIGRRRSEYELPFKGLFERGSDSRLNFNPPELAIVKSVDPANGTVTIEVTNTGMTYPNVPYIFSGPNNFSMPEEGDVVIHCRDKVERPYAYGIVVPEIATRIATDKLLPILNPGDYCIATKTLQFLRMRKTGEIELIDVLNNGFVLLPAQQLCQVSHRTVRLETSAGRLELGEPRAELIPGAPAFPVFGGLESSKHFLLDVKSNIAGVDFTKAKFEFGNILNSLGIPEPSWVAGGLLVGRTFFPSDGVGGVGGLGSVGLTEEIDDRGNARLLLPLTAIDGLQIEGMAGGLKTTFFDRITTEIGSTTEVTGIDKDETVVGSKTETYGSQSTTVATTDTLGAGVSITLTVGANSITITGSGIAIAGTLTALGSLLASGTATANGLFSALGGLAFQGGITGQGGGVLTGAYEVTGSLTVNGKPVLT